MKNFAIFTILAYLGPEAYSESCLYGHIQTYLGIVDNDTYDNYNKINLFFTLILHTFPRYNRIPYRKKKSRQKTTNVFASDDFLPTIIFTHMK